jgi:hypothetical protein
MSTCLMMGDFTLRLLPMNRLMANMGDRFGLSVKAPFLHVVPRFDK